MKTRLLFFSLLTFSLLGHAATDSVDPRLYPYFSVLLNKPFNYEGYAGEKCERVFWGEFMHCVNRDGHEEISSHTVTFLDLKSIEFISRAEGYQVTYNVKENFHHYWINAAGEVKANGDEEHRTIVTLSTHIILEPDYVILRDLSHYIETPLTGFAAYAQHKYPDFETMLNESFCCP